MTIVVLLILAIVWAVVLVPPWLRNRSESRPGDSISSFRQQLSVLERTTPGATPLRRPVPAPVAPPQPYIHPAVARRRRVVSSRRLARKRRRDIFTGLLVLMVATLALSFVPGLQMLRTVHFVLDALFVAYIALLVRAQRLAAEREMKVHYLPGTVAAEPALLLRRSAN
ncbi:MAG TPA: hypothetical protein VGB14_00550 [Acidimicrobiales bacterium]